MVKNSSFYSIQLDDSTYITKKAFILCFVRFVGEIIYLKNYFIRLICLMKRPTLKFSKHLIVISVKMKLIGKYIEICTYGAADITGHLSKVIAGL